MVFFQMNIMEEEGVSLVKLFMLLTYLEPIRVMTIFSSERWKAALCVGSDNVW